MARPITPSLEQRGSDRGPDLARRVEESSVVAVLDELDRRHQPVAAHLADVAVIGQRIALSALRK